MCICLTVQCRSRSNDECQSKLNFNEIFNKSIPSIVSLVIIFILTLTDPHRVCPRCLLKSTFDGMLPPPLLPIGMNPVKPFLDGKVVT